MLSLLCCIAAVPNAAEPVDTEKPDTPAFREVGAEVLAGVTTLCGSPLKNYIVEANGGGLVLGDFDGDEDIDLVVVNGSTLERIEADEPGEPPRLYLNDGSGHFSAAPGSAGDGPSWEMSGGRWGMGGAAGDVDGDGDLDLVVTQWGPDRLFLNEDGRGFREATEGSGLSGHNRWGTSAAFLDYDADGALDLVVVSYLSFRPGEIKSREDGACNWKGHAVMCGPEGLVPVHDQFYRGNGDGTFRDVSVPAGFRPRDAGYGLGVMTLDFDGDGDTDVYVSNDSTPNHLWENQGNGTFAEVGERLDVSHDGNGKEQAGMGIACGDVNADGTPDLFVTNFSAENNALYLSQPASNGRVRYRERASPARIGGPSRVDLGWGTSLADFDHDGDLDLAVFNGHVYPQADRAGTDTSYAQADHLVRQGAGGQFAYERLSDGEPSVSRASAAGDLDGDGDLDLVVWELGTETAPGTIRVLRNECANGNWLRVKLRGLGGNTAALGARVEARFELGSERVSRVAEIRSSGGFQASVPAEAHFGLGSAEAVELEVRWPSGLTTTHSDLAVNQVHTLHEPAPASDASESQE